MFQKETNPMRNHKETQTRYLVACSRPSKGDGYFYLTEVRSELPTKNRKKYRWHSTKGMAVQFEDLGQARRVAAAYGGKVIKQTVNMTINYEMVEPANKKKKKSTC